MSFNITAAMRQLESVLAKSGYYRHVQIGEPKQATERWTGALFMEQTITWLTLSTLCAVHVVILRTFDNMLHEPQEDVELEMAIIVDQVMDDLSGDFNLGDNISHIDIGGEHGPPLAARWSYIDVGGPMYRVSDITIPLVVNDVAVLTA